MKHTSAIVVPSPRIDPNVIPSIVPIGSWSIVFEICVVSRAGLGRVVGEGLSTDVGVLVGASITAAVGTGDGGCVYCTTVISKLSCIEEREALDAATSTDIFSTDTLNVEACVVNTLMKLELSVEFIDDVSSVAIDLTRLVP